jgi:hypothetical protein
MYHGTFLKGPSRAFPGSNGPLDLIEYGTNGGNPKGAINVFMKHMALRHDETLDLSYDNLAATVTKSSAISVSYTTLSAVSGSLSSVELQEDDWRIDTMKAKSLCQTSLDVASEPIQGRA